MRNLIGKPWLSVVIFSIYPILMLINENIDIVIPKNAIFPLFLSVFFSFFIYLTLSFITKNQIKSSLFVVISLLFFYYYGFIYYSFFNGLIINEMTIGRHRYFLPIWSSAFVVFTILLIKVKKPLGHIIKFLNYIFSLLVIFILISIFISIYSFFTSSSSQNINDLTFEKNVPVIKNKPDIYYIILDGYASQNTLKNFYNYDNSKFYESLIDEGFYIANNSTSNYSNTLLSLSSSLNMSYLNMSDNYQYERQMSKRITDNKVAKLLIDKGYKYVTFESGYSVNNGSYIADLNVSCSSISEFDYLLIHSSFLSPFSQFTFVRDRILCQFDTLKKVASNESEFIFAHIISPHPPFVFDRNGDSVMMSTGSGSWSDQDGYVKQLQFINLKILEVIDQIKLNHNKDDFIMIIQSDHGPASLGNDEMSNPSDDLIKERMGILNAYYVPNDVESRLYKDITPVNTFRVLLSELFNIDLPVLDDKNYFSPLAQEKTIFTDVTEILRH